MRTLIFIVALWIIFMIARQQWRSYQLKRKRNQRREEHTPLPKQMVKCDTCGIHIPENEAVKKRGRYYCDEHAKNR